MPTLLAQDGLNDYEVATISGRIESIVMGGPWRHSGIMGEYRLVVTRNQYVENTDNEFFIQWLRTEDPSGREVVHYSTRIRELDGYCLSDSPRLLASYNPNKFGQSFEVTSHPRGIGIDKVFIITPQPDFTYSIVSRSAAFTLERSVRSAFNLPHSVFIVAALLGGTIFGAYFTYATLRRRKAEQGS